MKSLNGRIREKIEEIKTLLPNLVEYSVADDIEIKCDEIIDLLRENGGIEHE